MLNQKKKKCPTRVEIRNQQLADNQVRGGDPEICEVAGRLIAPGSMRDERLQTRQVGAEDFELLEGVRN